MLSVALAVIAAIVATAHADNGGPIVQTSFGPITGRSYGGVEEYMGIPFATAERWADPVDWTEKWSNPRPAVKAMPGCGQDSKKPYGPGWSEDCLYLNVWKPAGVSESLPLLFFIYGGAFITGEASQYNCSVLAKKHNAVYVTANYRVGALGRLAVTKSSANFGLKDQQSALRWANKEAGAFGGDKSRLMIFGESAGGISVVTHILSPQSEGLFTRALSESGNSMGTTIEVAANQTEYFLYKLGCNYTHADLVCMRKASLEQVQAAQDFVDPPTLPVGTCQGWGPVIEGVAVPADPDLLLQTGKFNRKISALLGTNTNEGSAFAYDAVKAPYGPAEFRDYVISILGHGNPVPEKIVDKVLKQYPPFGHGQRNPVSGDNRVLAGDFFGDLSFVCPSRHVLRLLSTFSTKPMYRYRYNHLSYCEAGSPKGVSHGEEVPYVFDAPTWECPKFTPAEEHFSENIGAVWRQFADTGTLTAGWGKFSNSTDVEAILMPKTNGSAWNMDQDWRADFCEFWDHFCDNHFCDQNLTTTFKFSSKYLWQRARKTHGPLPDAEVTIVV